MKSVSTNTATANQSKESHSPNHSDEGLPSPPALVMLSSPRKSRRARFRRYHALGSDRISDSRRMSYLKDALPMSQMAGEKMAESPVHWNVPSAVQGHRKGALKNKIFDLKGFWVCVFLLLVFSLLFLSLTPWYKLQWLTGCKTPSYLLTATSWMTTYFNGTGSILKPSPWF